MVPTLLTVLIGLLVAAPALAQSAAVSGTVVDQTGGAVPGATVRLAATGAGGAASTTSGSAGQFRFLNVAGGTYEITVTLPGFASASRPDVTVSSDAVDLPPITLALAALSDTVVVSATRSEQALVDAPATMSIVTSATIASTPAMNYGDLLRSVPGANVIQLSARDINITSRQSTGTLTNSQLVLLDDRSIYLDFFGIVLWDFLPNNLSDIRQIEVIRGPASAVWGANALTGVVNVITKPPREALGTTVSLTGGWFSRAAGSGAGKGVGTLFGANATTSRAPNSRWAYRISAGYFNSDALPRPSGRIPLIQDPRDPAAMVGGAQYPGDGDGPTGTAFANRGTSQPKFDVRVDQEIDGGRITYAAGIAGSQGIIHTGIGPFDIQNGSSMGYTKANYQRGALKVNLFANLISAEAPNLLLADPVTQKPLQLNFKTQTYDIDARDSRTAGRRHVFTYGGNARRNNFDITIAPSAENRSELGAFVQDEILLDRVRFTVGGRLDKFGNIDGPVFSPRLAAIVKPFDDHAIRVSFNRAFRSPSVVNNYLDIGVVVPTDLSGLAPLLPPALQPAVAAPFPLVVRAVGSRLPIGGRAQSDLKEESLTAYEIAYTGTLASRTMIGAAFYVNDVDANINFSQLPGTLDPYTSGNPPPGWPLPASVLDVLAARGILLPRTAFTYLNLGPVRSRGIELSLDHRVSSSLTAFANYSWQAKPTPRDSSTPFPSAELALPPTNRFNIGFNADRPRWLGSATVNHTDRAFWSDVLSSPYHGFTDAYTMVNGSLGMKWAGGTVTTLVKVTNLFNAAIQQHVFGDIVTRQGVFEVRLKLK
ncbi:MAG: TonB-dependent receptor [Acidobacteriota bacterium]